ncbi:MAG: HAMP domain-containing sensor histidine kinase [Nocardioidaceae bacterium]
MTSDVRRTSVRLGLQTGLLVVAVIAIVFTLLFLFYGRAADAAADETLRDATANIDRADEAPPGMHVVVVTPRGRTESEGMPTGFPDEAALARVQRDGVAVEEDVVVRGDRYSVRTARVGDRVTQAVLDGHEVQEEKARIVTSLLVAGGVGVLLAALVATWMARRAMAPLAETLVVQRRFVADASHELRTPLTLLSTRLQMVARRAGRDGAVTGADLDGVLADTGRLTGILDDLLVAADSRDAPEETDVDLTELVGQCVDAASGSAEQAGISLRRLDGDPVRVRGVEAALRRAVTALVDNALGHARSEVEVTVESHRRTARVRVADDGPGISPEVRPRLFDRFTSARTAEDADGRRHYGIGLALVADVAAGHHGSVAAVDRADGRSGAVLELRLPAL